MSVGRIFLLEGTGETTSLAQVWKLFGHDITSFRIRDRKELSQTLMYISSMGWRRKRGKKPVFIHLSAHGSDDGLAIGPDDIGWAKLARLVVKTFSKIYGQRKPYKGQDHPRCVCL